MVSKLEQRLAFAARKAAAREEYLAYYLTQYQQQEVSTKEELMDFVGCLGEAYYRLALCQVPDLQATDFSQRIERIASYVGASAPNLAQVIRQVAAIQSLGETLGTKQQDHSLINRIATSLGTSATNLVRAIRQMMDIQASEKAPKTGRLPLSPALLAARDRDEESDEEKTNIGASLKDNGEES